MRVLRPSKSSTGYYASTRAARGSETASVAETERFGLMSSSLVPARPGAPIAQGLFDRDIVTSERYVLRLDSSLRASMRPLVSRRYLRARALKRSSSSELEISHT